MGEKEARQKEKWWAREPPPANNSINYSDDVRCSAPTDAAGRWQVAELTTFGLRQALRGLNKLPNINSAVITDRQGRRKQTW